MSDNGVGIPNELDLKNIKSLGLHLVKMIGEDQLGGEITLDRNNGTKFKIKF